jgi:hypothetical protein
MPSLARRTLSGLVGQSCWRHEVGEYRSLSLGFGLPIQRRTTFGTRTYGEWEAGTYEAAWRVIAVDKVICGSADAARGRDGANALLAGIDLGRLTSYRLGASEVLLRFDSGRAVEFLRVGSGEDEWFHVFCPNGLVVVVSGSGKWAVGPSDRPWPASTGVHDADKGKVRARR